MVQSLDSDSSKLSHLWPIILIDADGDVLLTGKHFTLYSLSQKFLPCSGYQKHTYKTGRCILNTQIRITA